MNLLKLEICDRLSQNDHPDYILMTADQGTEIWRTSLQKKSEAPIIVEALIGSTD